VWAYPRLRTGKRAKVAGNLLHVSSYRALNNIHIERWSIVGWTMRKTLPFCFGPILMTSCLRRKDTRLSVHYIFAFQESLGTRLGLEMRLQATLIPLVKQRRNCRHIWCYLVCSLSSAMAGRSGGDKGENWGGCWSVCSTLETRAVQLWR